MIGWRAALVPVVVLTVALVVIACGGDKEEAPDAAQEEPAAEEAAEQAEPEAQQQAPPEEEEEPAAEEVAEQTEPETAPDSERELLAYGEYFRASVEDSETARQFRFQGEAGDLVWIFVDGKDGMDPVTTLLEPNRIEIASNDDISGANRDSVIFAWLPTSGLQVVRVVAFDAASVGEFVIGIDRLGPPLDDDDNRVLAIGDVAQGSLGEPGDVDVFEFSGDANQRVQIIADGSIQTDVRIQIFDPDLLFLFEDDDSGHALDAELDLFLPKTGTYRVEVFAVGDRIGLYQLSIIAPAEPTEPDPGALTTLEAVARTYLVALQEGDALTLFALAGPEAIAIRGWETSDDVSRDIEKLQSTGVLGVALDATTDLRDTRGRVTIELDVAGAEANVEIRFDLANVNGQWLVDFFQRLFVPESAA